MRVLEVYMAFVFEILTTVPFLSYHLQYDSGGPMLAAKIVCWFGCTTGAS